MNTKININGKEYNTVYGMALLEWLGSELETDDIVEIIKHFESLEDIATLKLTHIPKLAFLLRGAISAGGGEITKEEAEDWCLPNALTAMRVLNSFSATLPGRS